MRQNLIRIVFIAIGALLVADTVFVKTRSNWNLGVALPAILGAPLIVYGVFKAPLDAFFAEGFGKALKFTIVGVYLFVIISAVVLTAMMLHAAKDAPDPGADAVIVLGAGIKGDKVSYTLKNRLDAAADYYEENPEAVIVLAGGYGRDKEYSEAYAMEKYMLERGVPASAMIKEENSTSTYENFTEARKILDERFNSDYRVVYSTNGFHILRAGMKAKQAGLNAQGLSSPTPPYIAVNSYLRESLALLAAYAGFG